MIALVAVLTFSLAASILEPIVPLIPSQREEAVELIAFHAALATLEIAVVTVVIFSFTVSIFSPITLLIVSQIERTVSFPDKPKRQRDDLEGCADNFLHGHDPDGHNVFNCFPCSGQKSGD